MNITIPDLTPALPEIFLLTAASLILLIDLFVSERNRFVSYLLTQLTLIGCTMITLSTGNIDIVYTFSDMFVDDPMADILKVCVYLSTFAVLVYSRSYLIERNLFRAEFFVLMLFAILGMQVMISANHFLILYIGLELLSLSLYALVALQRDSRQATEAAMKYFVLGALASGMLLYGMSMIYGVTGSLNIVKIAHVIQAGVQQKTVLIFGLVFLVSGLAFKLGVVPFHMWLPDVYQGASTPVTLFIGSAPKLAAFAMTLRLLGQGLQAMVVDWQGMLIILAVLSMIIGNVTAIMQTNIKRMFAYSTISHMGFFLLGILSGGLNGYTSSMVYVVVYVLMSLAGFGMLLLLSSRGIDIENIDDFKGLNQKSPWYAFLMLLVMFSMAGVPPTVGFYAKFVVLQAALDAGFISLTIVAVLLSLVGAFYYIRIVKMMYFDKPERDFPLTVQNDAKVLMSANALALLVLGLLPQPLFSLCGFALQHSF